MVAASCRRQVAHGAESDSACVRNEGGRVLSETERTVLCSAVWAVSGTFGRGVVAACRCSDRLPTLRHPHRHDLRPGNSVLEFSTDRFVTLIYSTAWAGIALPIGSWTPPAELWRSAPADRTVFWRVRSRASETNLVASGRIAPQSFVAPPRAGDPRDRS
jgi:hypothetical protein